MTSGPRRYTAPWVLPLEGPPLAGGAILLDPTGRIRVVGLDRDVPVPPGTSQVDLGQAVILPGLVNAHTHLELTGFDAAIDEPDFPSWIRQVIALKATRGPADYLAAARRGIQDCWAAGVTTVADTGDSGAVIQALSESAGSGIAYHEVFGPDPALADSQFAAWTNRLEQLSAYVSPRVRLGVSPHAPYSVSGPLYRRVSALADQRHLPVAVHLAESRAESRLLEQADGGFAQAWQSRGIALPELPGRSPVAWLDEHQVLGPRTLCIHLVQANEGDLDLLTQRGSSVAHCPRSNQRHGHGAARLGAMLDRGLRVGVGTDSVLTLAPLDLLAEVRAARALAGLSAEAALRLVTLDAARALGLEHEIGSLIPGKWADLAAFRLPGPVDASALAGTLLSLGRESVLLTVVGGREVFRA